MIEYKTIEEWFNTLIEPIRTQALQNVGDAKVVKIKSMEYAFNYFIWSSTPQGHTYWNNVYWNIKKYTIQSYQKYLKK